MKLKNICLTFSELITQQATKYKNKLFLTYAEDGRTLTYAQLNEYAQKIAALLATQGIKRGDVVSIILPNCPEYVDLYTTWYHP